MTNQQLRNIPDVQHFRPDSSGEIARVAKGKTDAEETTLPGEMFTEPLLVYIFLHLKPVVGTEINVFWAH